MHVQRLQRWAIASLPLFLVACGGGQNSDTAVTPPVPTPPPELPPVATTPPTAPPQGLQPPITPQQRLQTVVTGRTDPFGSLQTAAVVQLPTPPRPATPPGGPTGPGGTPTAGGQPSGPGGILLPPVPFAEQVAVTGVLVAAGQPFAVVEVPGAFGGSQQVRVGSTLAGGRLTVARIDAFGPDPVVYFRERGIRQLVSRRVGQPVATGNSGVDTVTEQILQAPPPPTGI
ncbi:hypothetical protein VZH09_09800 [Synechococcus elongatus IITB7]|uniref:hypothetical protein n=1 Tax=Synechococcus elongatus TaxID=32046 RepID=UPI0030D45F77